VSFGVSRLCIGMCIFAARLVRLELGILPPNPGLGNVDCARRLT
jgi:hypothetical protein